MKLLKIRLNCCCFLLQVPLETKLKAVVKKQGTLFNDRLHPLENILIQVSHKVTKCFILQNEIMEHI